MRPRNGRGHRGCGEAGADRGARRREAAGQRRARAAARDSDSVPSGIRVTSAVAQSRRRDVGMPVENGAIAACGRALDSTAARQRTHGGPVSVEHLHVVGREPLAQPLDQRVVEVDAPVRRQVDFTADARRCGRRS